MPTVTLNDFILSDNQKIWLEHVYKQGYKMAEMEVYRELAEKLPEGFDAFGDLRHFWQHDHLTLFAIYKLNKQDRIFEILDAILNTLRDVFQKESGRVSIGITEISDKSGIAKDDVKMAFESSYFWEYWIDNSNSWERLDYNSQTKEHEYRMEYYKALAKLRKYVGIDAQMEKRWQKEVGQLGGLSSIQPFSGEAVGAVGGLFVDRQQPLEILGLLDSHS
jgi:hypothetical protein